MPARPTRSSRSSWVRRSSRARTSSKPRLGRSATLTSEAVPARERLRDPNGAFEFEPHHCFACGDLNEHGLHLQLHANPDGAWVELALPPEFQGWDSIAHGGIVCTILDEVMAWSVIGRGTWGVTARLNVAFRRPIRTR